ncbi:MAG TPA: hypothetical protein VL689_20915 [Paraburkholderia sp.]|nr:hypothetical protein [Paraburkholderia sp.]
MSAPSVRDEVHDATAHVDQLMIGGSSRRSGFGMAPGFAGFVSTTSR